MCTTANDNKVIVWEDSMSYYSIQNGYVMCFMLCYKRNVSSYRAAKQFADCSQVLLNAPEQAVIRRREHSVSDTRSPTLTATNQQ